MTDSARLTIGDKEIELPIHVGTENELGVEISALRASTGVVTLDAGFANTAPAKSAITYLDGERGVLRYRGYSIEQLAENASFVEVAYLLLYGELPTTAQLAEWESGMRTHVRVPEGIERLFEALPATGHPMAMLESSVAALAAFSPPGASGDAEARELSLQRLLAQLPTLAALALRRTRDLPFVEPDPELSYTANFLRMMFGTPGEAYDIDPAIARAIDMLLILHADHEQNCSTSTVRIIGSSQANLYASVAGGIGALWGPLHGGANQKVLEMLQLIAEDEGDVDAAVGKYVAKAKDKTDPFRLMGFGHRVYKNFDPRARILKGQCDIVLPKLGVEDSLLEIAKRLEQVALEDEYFVARKLYPNVDFYSGILYRALGIPTNMFTVMFAVGRLPGWVSHWRELNEQGSRIGRPRQIYTGATAREFVGIEAR